MSDEKSDVVTLRLYKVARKHADKLRFADRLIYSLLCETMVGRTPDVAGLAKRQGKRRWHKCGLLKVPTFQSCRLSDSAIGRALGIDRETVPTSIERLIAHGLVADDERRTPIKPPEGWFVPRACKSKHWPDKIAYFKLPLLADDGV